MYQARLKKLRALMAQMSVDGFLVTNRTNIYYLSGFLGDDGLLLITEKDQYLITDSRFEEQIKSQVQGYQVKITRAYLQEALVCSQKDGVVALAFESDLDYASYDYLDENAWSDVVALSGVIQQLRSVKDTDEIEKIRQACQLAAQGYDFILNHVRAGMPEITLANDLEYFMKQKGASQASFETILASGEKTTWPHGVAGNKLIQLGDLITLDFGFYKDYYTSDVTRTFALGPQSDEIKKIYQIVLEAKNRTIAAIKAGVNGQELDQIGRQYIESQGYGPYFNHGMGHGIGLDIHEGPNVSSRIEDYLQANQVITIEPGIYVPGVGGVRIEDDILVTENGYENLTDFKQEWLEL